MTATEKTLQQERYCITEQLGYTDKGAIFEAYDSILKINVMLTEVAGEVKSASPAQQQARKSAFAEKAKVLIGIKHESLPRIHDYFSENDLHYLVLEQTEGTTLDALSERGKKSFSLAEVSGWADQLLDTLNYLHRYVPPVIHRQIKPQNIQLTADGKIKLLALGDAQIFGAKTNTALSTSAADDALPYLPLELIWEGLDPASQKVILSGYDERSEKILEQPADARSDIYGVGATIYYLLTGKTPVDALVRSIEILDGNADPLPPPTELNAEIPAAISEVLMRALEIRRENRFDSAVIMRQVLRTALVRVKERENEEAKQQVEAAAQLLKAAEQKRLEQERQLLEQKRLEIEAEQQRLDEERRLARQKQLEMEAERQRLAELVNQQRHEAEAKNCSPNKEPPKPKKFAAKKKRKMRKI